MMLELVFILITILVYSHSIRNHSSWESGYLTSLSFEREWVEHAWRPKRFPCPRGILTRYVPVGCKCFSQLGRMFGGMYLPIQGGSLPIGALIWYGHACCSHLGQLRKTPGGACLQPKGVLYTPEPYPSMVLPAAASIGS